MSILTPKIWTRQPQIYVQPRKSIFGAQVGTTLNAALRYPLNPKGALTVVGGGFEPRQIGMAYIPTSIEQGIYAQAARPFVLGTDSGLSLLVVMRKPTTANVANTTVASMGASGGSSGNTLLRLLTGTSPANLRLQLQNSAGTNNFDFNTSGITINDQAWHTVLVSIDPTATTGSATVYIDGTAAGSATISGTVSATTFDYVTACCTIRGGLRIASAGGIFDIALVAPIHGYLDASAAASLRNPWQIFEPIQSRIWVPVAASGGGTTGTGTITEAGDAAAAAGTVTHLGTAAFTEAGDTAAAIGDRGHAGAAAITETGDTADASGTVGSVSGVTGSAAIAEAGDSAEASGTITRTGSAAVLEAGDIVVGDALLGHIGAAAIAESGDTAAAAGTASSGAGTGATAAEIWAYEIEPGVSAAVAMRRALAMLCGKVVGAGTDTEIFRDINDTRDAVTVTVDAQGNRTSIVFNDGA